MKNIIIANRNGKTFTWFRGNCVVKSVNGKDFITTLGEPDIYEPDFKVIVERLVNLNLNNVRDILTFVKRYGLPGTFYYYIETGSYKSYVLNGESNKEDPLLKWEQMFGAKIPGGLPYISNANAFATSSKDTRGELTNIPEKKADELLKADRIKLINYGEPLEFLSLAIREFRHALKYMLLGKYHPRLKLKLEIDEHRLMCPVTSLLEGAYSFLMWQFAHNKKIKECIGQQKFDCEHCEYGKRFFWEGDARQVWGKADCKLNQKERAANYRAGKTKKIPSRSYKNRQEALNLYNKGMRPEGIAETLKINVELVYNWIKKNNN